MKRFCLKMRLTVSFYLLQSIYILAVQQNKGRYITKIKKTFDFDLTKGTEIGEVLTWRISKDQKNYKPLSKHEITGPFQHNETILIFAHKESHTLHFYYWLGTKALLDNKKILAKCAMLFYSLAFKYYDTLPGSGAVVYLSRESQGIETNSFKETLIGLIDRHPVVKPEKAFRYYHTYLNNQFPSNIPNLYVLRGQGHTSIKKVALHPDWLEVDDACLILETGFSFLPMDALNIRCGPNSSINAQNRSALFAKEFIFYAAEIDIFHNRNKHYRIMTNYPSNNDYMEKFEKIVKAGNHHNSHEIDEPQDRFGNAEDFLRKCDDIILIYYDKLRRKKYIPEKTIYSDLFLDKYGAYIVDTKNAAGIFLIIGSHSRMDVRMLAVQEMENYLYKDPPNQRPIRVRIMENDSTFNYIDFNIQLADWPTNQKEKFW